MTIIDIDLIYGKIKIDPKYSGDFSETVNGKAIIYEINSTEGDNESRLTFKFSAMVHQIVLPPTYSNETA